MEYTCNLCEEVHSEEFPEDSELPIEKAPPMTYEFPEGSYGPPNTEGGVLCPDCYVDFWERLR